MKISEILAFVFGSFLFAIGAGLLVVSLVITYNSKQIEFATIAGGLFLAIIGWIVARYAAKSTGKTVLDNFLSVF